MTLKEFKKRMKKAVFSFEEARIVAFETKAATLRLELHQWKKAGEIIGLKRGLYMMAGVRPWPAEVAVSLYSPSYISLESALNHYGLLPDVPFAITLVTTKTTRKFNTPVGQFTYQKIPNRAFLGFDTATLTAKREKALVDYLYLKKNRLVSNDAFWLEMRWQNLGEVNFRLARKFAKYFGSQKLLSILKGLESYAKTHPIA